MGKVHFLIFPSLLLISLLPFYAEEVGVSGKWNLTLKYSSEKTRTIIYEFKQKGEDLQITDIILDFNKISCYGAVKGNELEWSHLGLFTVKNDRGGKCSRTSGYFFQGKD